MTTGVRAADQPAQQSRLIGESDQRIKASLNAHKYDFDKLRDLLQKLDFVQLAIFWKWRESESDGVALSAQLFTYDAAGLIYDYESERYRKPNERELHQTGNWFPPNLKQPSEKDPRPKILGGRQVIAELEECVRGQSE